MKWVKGEGGRGKGRGIARGIRRGRGIARGIGRRTEIVRSIGRGIERVIVIGIEIGRGTGIVDRCRAQASNYSGRLLTNLLLLCPFPALIFPCTARQSGDEPD